MDNNDDNNLIYGIVDGLLKNVTKTIHNKFSEEKAISSTACCNLDAAFRLLKIAYPCIDPGDTSRQSHIFLEPSTRSERVVFTTADANKNQKIVTSKAKKLR